MRSVTQYKDLPGYEIIEKGLRDLEKGIESVERLIIEIISPELVRYELLAHPTEESSQELKLYKMLSHHGIDAHNQYNSLLARADKLISYLK